MEERCIPCAVAVRSICHWQDYLKENICQMHTTTGAGDADSTQFQVMTLLRHCNEIWWLINCWLISVFFLFVTVLSFGQIFICNAVIYLNVSSQASYNIGSWWLELSTF